MYVVCVNFVIHKEYLSQFLPLMQKQAENSLQFEEKCQYFDVCVSTNDENEIFLYEIYDNEPAFKEHLDSAHFKTFDKQIASMVLSKKVTTYHKLS